MIAAPSCPDREPFHVAEEHRMKWSFAEIPIPDPK